MDDNDNKIVGKYLKKFGLSRAKQIVYIMRTSEDEYPKNKYPNWEDYIKASQSCGPWFICNDTIEELQYQLDHYKCQYLNTPNIMRN